MKNYKEIRQHVNVRLKYCMGESFMIFFITAGALAAFVMLWMIITGMFVMFTDPYVTALSVIAGLILMWLVFTPFKYGVKWYRIQHVRGQSVPARGIFSCYMSLSRLLKMFRVDFGITMRKLCVILPAAASAGAAYYMLQGERNILLYCVSAAFMLISAGLLILYIILNIRYSLVSFIYVLEPDIPIKTLIRESKRLVKGRISYCVKILLSAAWLIIPCLLIFPAVFIVPYIQMVYTAMINEMIRQEERYADYVAG